MQHAINPGRSADRQDARSTEERRVVELLLKAGANVEVVGKDGRRPLHLSASFGRADVAELLLARGADVDARDTLGLDAAARRHQPA